MIQITPAATREVLRLKSKQKGSNLLFRLGVKPGGCCHLYYQMGFAETLEPDDGVYHCGGVQVVIDHSSLSHLEGLVLDYSEDLMGGGFRFSNPNASQTCGCSHSFMPKT